MAQKIMRAISFNRVSKFLTPRMNNIPKPFLEDIQNKLTNTSGKQFVISNVNPLIKSYKDFDTLFNNSLAINEYKPLNKYVESALVNAYFRDISTNANPSMQVVIMRSWFNYQPQNKLIKMFNIYEITDDFVYVETNNYYKIIKNTNYIPSFEDINDNDSFIKKMQILC